nr:hypothetical protein [Tanacetum cinerariifolium]
IYVSCVKQLWATAKVKRVNDQDQIQALVDKKKVIITEDIIRSDLRFDDTEGTACLFNEAIFKGLARMSSMASAIICLADNQKFNFSKYIFDNLVKSLEGGVKFYLFLRFQQVFLDNQVEGMARHKEMYVISSHSKKIFANMRRIKAGFSGVVTPLFDTMMVQANADMDDTPRKEEEVSHDESDDEDHVLTPSSDPLPIGDDSYTLNELMKKVSKLLKWRKTRSGGLRRLMKIGSCRRVKSPLEKDSLGEENDDEMFGVDDLSREKVVLDTTTGEHEEHIIEDVSTAKPVTTAGEVVTTVADKVSAALTTYVSEDEITMAQALAALKSIKPKVVDKGKAKMIEPEVPIKKKDRIGMDEEYARQLEAKEQEADSLLAERLQAREREEFSKVQKARLLVELIEKIKKHFATMRAQEKRNKPPTKTQMKSQIGKEAQESNTKRIVESLESDISKKQKVDENVEPVIDDTKELKKCMKIVLNDRDEVLIEATPLSSRSPTIIDYKIHNEGKKTYFKIIRADSNSQVYQTFEKVFKNFNREDVEVLWAIVKDKFKKEKPVDDMDNLLFRTLKTMFEHHVEDTIWTYQQGLANVKNWKLFKSYGVYCITMQSTIYYLLVEKVYPLTRNTLHQLWNDVRLQVDHNVEMAYDLLRFIRKQLMEGYTPQ